MQLLYPNFLWGLLAVALPVLIHLVQLRRPQRVLFTNIGFIQEVELTVTRQRRIQEILVLLARVLAVTLLVLAFCQPYLSAHDENIRPKGSTVAVLIDDTPSMQAQGAKKENLLQEAMAGARALGKSYGSGGQFELIGARIGIANQAAYETKIASMQAAKGKLGWDNIGSRYLVKAAIQQSLYIFSDFQKSTGGNSFFKNIPVEKEIVLIPQIAQQSSNAYVDSVWLEDAFVRARVNLGLHIRLRNGGDKELTDCPVKVLLGERQVAAFRTTIAAGGSKIVVVQVQLPDTKLAQGRVVTEDAPVTFDNSYYFTLQPAAAIQVLEIGNEPVAQRAYANEPLFTYAFEKPQELNYNKLQQANLIMINELSSLNTGLREALVKAAQRGASVVLIPTSQVAARESYHQLFRALGLGGEQWNTTPVVQDVAMPGKQTPFFKDVFGAQLRQVAMPQATAALSWGHSGTDILRLRDGSSYLTEFASGAGRVYVFASPLDKAYSDIVNHALFVPVLYRLAMLSYHSGQRLAYSLTEPTITLSVPQRNEEKLATSKETGFRLVRDSSVFVPVQRIQGLEAHLDVPIDLREPGFYEVRQQGKLVTTLALNADQHESELAAYSAAELRALIGPNRPNMHVLEADAPQRAIANYRAEQTGQSLWRYCLALALVFLFAEGLLLRFGRPKVAAGRPLATA